MTSYLGLRLKVDWTSKGSKVLTSWVRTEADEELETEGDEPRESDEVKKEVDFELETYNELWK